jgi:CBS domain-containing protein
METVQDLLGAKPPTVWTVEPGTSVYEALELMADKDIGAVLVLEGGALAGIFSERDYARKVVLRGKTSRDTTVGELMTKVLFYVTARQTIEECLALMTQKRVRHLPVLDGTHLVGVISIGDVGKAIISEQRTTIHHLETYITGGAVSTKSL